MQIHGRLLAISFSENKSICSCRFGHGLQAHVCQFSLIIFLYSSYHSQIANVHIFINQLLASCTPNTNLFSTNEEKECESLSVAEFSLSAFLSRSSSEICLIWTVVTNNLSWQTQSRNVVCPVLVQMHYSRGRGSSLLWGLSWALWFSFALLFSAKEPSMTKLCLDLW